MFANWLIVMRILLICVGQIALSGVALVVFVSLLCHIYTHTTNKVIRRPHIF